MIKNYLKRYIDSELDFVLECMGAVVITGPKGCGKTTTAKQHSNSSIQLQHPTLSNSYLKLADTDSLSLLDGKKPRLIDEWQMAPQLWDAVRYSVDKTDDEGLYILTGSTMVDGTKIMHNGAGRIHRLLMRPMSLYESGESNGKISLMELFKNPDLNINGITSDLSLKDLIFASCRGGWPESLNKKNSKQQLSIAKSYFNRICKIDANSIDNVKRSPDKVKSLLKSYAGNISTITSNKKIIGDIKKRNGKMSETTYYDYINVLKQLFIVEEVSAWTPNIRPYKTIRKTPKKSL